MMALAYQLVKLVFVIFHATIWSSKVEAIPLASSSRLLKASPTSKLHETLLHDIGANSECLMVAKWEFSCPGHLIQGLSNQMRAYDIKHKVVKPGGVASCGWDKEYGKMCENKLGYDCFSS